MGDDDGTCEERLKTKTKKVVKIFDEGDSVGEIAALLQPGCKATGTIRARTACEVCTLSSTVVEQLAKAYSELTDH
eukprot:3382552-Prymnesium_polylepis.1